MGHAWVQARAGGSVTVVGADLNHPWWPVLRAWLPAEAPLWLVANGTADALPQRPFPPVQLGSLLRSGVPTWPAELPLRAALAWLVEREPLLLVPREAPHPALLIAYAAIASWGWRVVWPISGLDSAWAAALAYIGQRQLPLQLALDTASDVPPGGWWPVPARDAGLWLQHEWPTLYTPD
jgi:hypothetical protein